MRVKPPEIPEPIEFEWDESNTAKVRLRHGIFPNEAEQPFVNRHQIFFDKKHSKSEQRYQLLGANDIGQILFIVFTTRGDKIRIISARRASKKERIIYYGKKT